MTQQIHWLFFYWSNNSPLHSWTCDDIISTVLSASPELREDTEGILSLGFLTKSYTPKQTSVTEPESVNNPISSPIQQTQTHTIMYTHGKFRAWTSIQVQLKFGLKRGLSHRRQRRAFIDGALTSRSCIKLILKAINTHGQGKVIERPMFLTCRTFPSQSPDQRSPALHYK